MNRKSLFMLAVGCLALAGCSAQFLKTAQKECSDFGLADGSPEYAKCVEERYDAKQTRLGDALFSPTPQQGPTAAELLQQQAANARSPSQSTKTTAFLKRHYVSGLNKVCVYDQLGSELAITIGATELCPLTN